MSYYLFINKKTTPQTESEEMKNDKSGKRNNENI